MDLPPFVDCVFPGARGIPRARAAGRGLGAPCRPLRLRPRRNAAGGEEVGDAAAALRRNRSCKRYPVSVIRDR